MGTKLPRILRIKQSQPLESELNQSGTMENSLLNELPAEIRNAIYAHTLFEQDEVDITTEPALLKTCHQIRREASLMFWAINRFKVDIHEEKIDHKLCRWLKTAGARLLLVKGLTIHIEDPSVGSKVEAIEDETHEASLAGFLHLLHILV